MAVNYKEYTFGNEADTSHFVLGEYQGIKYAEFQLKSFSSGTMAFITDDAVLPLDLLSFTAVNMDSRVLLQWHTVNEVDVSHFEVERGKDARVWELLNIQTAKNGIENHYTQWDEQPFSDISYYRLKMIDLDGTYKYSKIVQVGQDKNVIPVCKVYPNPSSGNIFVQWNSNEAHAIMTVYDASGAKIHLQLLDNGVNAIDLSHLPGGLYGLNIISNQYEFSQKLILE